MSFKDMKKTRSDQLNKYREEADKQNSSSFKKDERFWEPTVDKAGNGYAVLRFLPQPAGEDMPWVRTFKHAFQGPGGWFIDECLTTIGKECPVCQENNVLWNSGIEANKAIVRQRKRKLTYVSNIYVVEDPSNPDNNGKVFLYRYGKKIYDKINDLMNPAVDGMVSVDPFNFWDGATFQLKIRKVEGYRNYDTSQFKDPAQLLETDKAMEALYKLERPLLEFHGPEKFKPYDEQKTRLMRVLGGGASSAGAAAVTAPAPEAPATAEDDLPWDEPKGDESAAKADDDLTYFENLANG